MARRRRYREEKKRFDPRLAALFAVGIMIVSSLAYAILSKPPVEAPPTPSPEVSQPEQQPAPEFTSDTDGDGIPDTIEAEIGTDPWVRDTRETLAERRSQLEAAYSSGAISREEYTALSSKLELAEALLR